MNKFIILIFTLFLISGCFNDTATHLKQYPKKGIHLKDGTILKVFIADTEKRQEKGLSGILKKDFSIKETMLFPANKMIYRRFWMPDTHFNLDIVFMDTNYNILDIHRNLQHYPSRKPKNKIPLSRRVFSQHVLEIRSDSPHAKKIRLGDKLIIK